jgi:actin-related protein
MKLAVNTAKLLRNVPLPDEIAVVHENGIVLDFGSTSTRIGFSGEDCPRLTYPTVVSRCQETVDTFAKAFSLRNTPDVTVSRVVERGLIQDWHGFEALAQNIFDRLNLANDASAPLLITESALAPKEHREEVTATLFEKLRAEALYFAASPVLALYASGRTTGLVVEMNSGTCNTVPIFEGFALFHAILQSDLGGQDVSAIFGATALRGQAVPPPPYGSEVVTFMKERYCWACPSKAEFLLATSGGAAAAAAASAGEGVGGSSAGRDVVQHQLPDGTVFTMGADRFVGAECILDPSLIPSGIASIAATPPPHAARRGLHQLAVESIRKCDHDIAPQLFHNVVFAGGGSLIKNMPERIAGDIQEQVPAERLRSYAGTERQTAAWVGGSILASLPTFQDMWVTRQEYDECGAMKKALTRKKCF